MTGLGTVGVLLLRRARLLEGEELLGPEGLVVDLCRRLDQVLEVGPVALQGQPPSKVTKEDPGDGPGEEVAEVVELAVLLVLDVDDAPAVLAAADGLTVDDDVAF